MDYGVSMWVIVPLYQSRNFSVKLWQEHIPVEWDDNDDGDVRFVVILLKSVI